jgi:molybdopterin-guanine dinucleotide biosynthesis protein A
MGRDKALLELGSLKLIERAKMQLCGAGLEVWIAGARNPELASFAPVVADAWDNAGPLGGVCSALRFTNRDWAAFVTIDQPLMAPALLTGLLEHARTSERPVTVASVRGVPQTFPAVVRRTALEVLERELAEGRLGCMKAFCTAGRNVVAAEDLAAPEARHLVDLWFSNVNTPEDLEQVKACLKLG